MPRLQRTGTLVLMCAVYFAAGLTLAAIGPNLNAFAANIAQDVATVGAIFVSFSLGTVVVQLVAPQLSSRYGQRVLLALGALCMGCGILGESLSRSLNMLLSTALVGGLGFGAILAAGSVLIPRLFAPRGAAAFNLVNLFFGLGSIIGPLLAGWNQARGGSSLLALWVGAALLLLLLPLISRAADVPPPQHGAGNATGRPPWGLVVLLGLMLLCYSGTEIAIGGWTAVYLELGAAMTPEYAAFAVSGFWLALTIGRGVGAGLGLRLNALQLLGLAGSILLCGALLLVTSVGDAQRSVVALLIMGLAGGPIFPTIMALVATATRGRGTATSLALGIGNWGGALIPPALGLVL
ncbi:MAG: MFS transporter, partial [Candidatus Viridilinea halotolerans]